MDDDDRIPLSERLSPVVYALVLFFAVAIAAVILLALGFIFIGIIVLAAAPVVGFIAWVVAD